MKVTAARMVTFSVAALVAAGVVALLAGQASAGEAFSDRVVNSLLLRGEPPPAPVAGQRPPAAASFSLAKESSPGAPPRESFAALGKLKSLGAAGLVVGGLALFGFGAWKNGWRLKPAGAKGSPIRLVSTRPLGDKKAIAVVDVEGQRLVVGMTAQQVTLLTALPGRREEPPFDYTFEEELEEAAREEPAWSPRAEEAAADSGAMRYPDLDGIMAAMRG